MKVNGKEKACQVIMIQNISDMLSILSKYLFICEKIISIIVIKIINEQLSWVFYQKFVKKTFAVRQVVYGLAFVIRYNIVIGYVSLFQPSTFKKYVFF